MPLLAVRLSTSALRGVSFHGQGLLELLDGFLIDILLPLAALGLALGVSKRLSRERLESEFVNDDSIATKKLFSHWIFAVRWFAPGVIILAFVVAGLGLLRSLLR